MQKNPPGVELLQVDGCKQSVKEPCDHDNDGKGHDEVVQQIVGFVLLCKRPDVEDKDGVSLSHVGG